VKRPSGIVGTALLLAAGVAVALGLAVGVARVVSPARDVSAASEATFVGRAACAGCHAVETAAWTGSHHDLAMAEPTPQTVRGDFSGVRFEGDGMRARFFRDGASYRVETDGPDGRPATYEVAYTFGWRPLQQYLLRFPGGRLQAFPVAWDTERERWFFLYPGRSIPPTDWLHWTRNAQNWNGMCASCHSTNVVKGYDPEKDGYATTFSEVDVSCEACHGPGSRHVAWAGAPPAERSPLEGSGLPLRTSGITNRQLVELCAPCHARRTELADWDHRRPALLDAQLPALLEEGLYHADGQVLEEDFEYGSFVQSRMYRMGVACTHCHDAHTLKLRREGNGVCLQCHPAPKYDDPAHHGHAREWRGRPSAAALCVSCHMPKSPFMVVHWRADHSIRIPRPDLTRSIGTPNACASAGCHADRPLDWIVRAYDERFGADRAPHFGTALAAGRAGDPAAAGALASLAGDPVASTLVRATALSLLGRFDGAEAAAALDRALASEEPLLRRTALAALPFARAEERASRLAALLRDPVRAVRVEAANRLAAIAPGRLAPADAGALAAALAEYRAAMERSLDFPFAAHNLGLLAERTNDPARAEASYRRAIEVDPLWPPPRMNLARLLASQGRSGESEALLREALAARADLPEAAYSLGLLLAETGRVGEAAGFLARAAEGMPGNARAAYNAGLALAQAGRDAEAETMLRRSVAADPAGYDSLFALADFLMRRDRRAEAAELARRMMALDPARPEGAQLLRLAGG